MLRVVRKLFLLAVLVLKLSKQLVVGLFLFVVKRISSVKEGFKPVKFSFKPTMKHAFAMIAVGLVVTMSLAIFHQAPAEQAEATESVSNGQEIAMIGDALPENEEMYEEDPARVDENPARTMDSISPEESAETVDGFMMQAMSLSQVNTIGRKEPFAASMDFDMGGDASPSFGVDTSTLSPAELARIKAEERRRAIEQAIETEVMVKGIVVNQNSTNPLAALSLANADGSSSMKMVKPTQSIGLSACQAQIKEVSKNYVTLACEGVVVRKYLPEFQDEISASTPTASVEPTSSFGGGEELVAPPAPGGSVTPPKTTTSSPEAQKKIQEIDQLLNSF